MRVVVVPSPPALLPSYAGLSDPLAEVRTAALDACAWLTGDRPDSVLVLGSDALALRVGRSLLGAAGWTDAVWDQSAARTPLATTDSSKSATVGRGAVGPGDVGGGAVLVVADGSARRGEKAPGHLDDRAHGYDAGIGRALAAGDAAALARLDEALGSELLARGVPAFRALGELTGPLGPVTATTDYDGDPYGVAYWVVRWDVGATCGS